MYFLYLLYFRNNDQQNVKCKVSINSFQPAWTGFHFISATHPSLLGSTVYHHNNNLSMTSLWKIKCKKQMIQKYCTVWHVQGYNVRIIVCRSVGLGQYVFLWKCYTYHILYHNMYRIGPCVSGYALYRDKSVLSQPYCSVSWLFTSLSEHVEIFFGQT